MSRIVVGVDGSTSSTAALRWAIQQAKLTGSEVEAITAWRVPAAYGIAPAGDGMADFEGDAKELLAKVLAEVGELETDVTIRSSVAEGDPGYVLADAARGADLLVVGSRPDSGFAGVIGSDSQHCVRHAPCPVLVMRNC